MTEKRIGIVLGSHSDVKRMRPGLDRLTALGVGFEMVIASAHRTPERLAEWLGSAEERGVKVIVAGAGAAAHLPGVVASKTLLPVIGVPFNASPIGGTDALYSIVQMPPGIPVATVGIDSAENAVILALHILGTSDPTIRDLLKNYRGAWQDKIADQNEKLYEELPDARPGGAVARVDSPDSGQVEPRSRVRSVDPDNPGLEIVEGAMDVLFAGGVVALPTDTVYGFAVDATNPKAVEKLRRLKGREEAKPIAVLIDSMAMFRQLAADVAEDVERLLDAHWPGALTVVAPKRGSGFAHVSGDASLGVRMPDCTVTLGLINMLGRPLAVSSANAAGGEPALRVEDIAPELEERLDLIIDAGRVPGGQVSTVLDLMELPYRILREGAVGRPDLADLLGERLAS